MSTEEVELDGLEYLSKFTERLYIAMACINDGRDITEEDYGVLEEVHRIYSDGRLPFYKTVCNETATNSTQAELFSDNSSVT